MRPGDPKAPVLDALRLAVKAGNEARAKELLYDVLRWSLAGAKADSLELDVEKLCQIRDERACLRLVIRRARRGESRGEQGAGSRFGGAPFLPPRMKWPRGPKGPLDFIGQLDFAELAPMHRKELRLPNSGVLSLFYDLENPTTGDDPTDRRAWKTCFVPTGAEGRFIADSEASDSVPLRMIDASFVRSSAPSEGHQVGGAPAWIQGDGRPQLALRAGGLSLTDIEGLIESERRGTDVVSLAREANQWRLLWQIPSETGLFEWFGSGTLYVLIREDDLEAQRFDKALCLAQCS